MIALLRFVKKPWIILLCAWMLVQCTDNPELEEPVADTVPAGDIEIVEELPPPIEDLEEDFLTEQAEEPPYIEEPAPIGMPTDEIYFDFDDYGVLPDMEEKLAQIATYLKENNQYSLTIEGHCDERGTQEYNLALGEKRALAVYRFLEQLGVDPTKLKTISYGEEMPKVAGNDEMAWSQNRRAAFIFELSSSNN